MALSAQDWAGVIRRAGSAYGVDAGLLFAVNRREQSGSPDFVVNNWDSNAKKGTPSGGPFQFIKPTFDAFARQARDANPGAWRGVKLDWRNPVAQALTASWAFKNGKGSHWSTFGKAQKDAAGGSEPSVTGSSVASPAASGGRFNAGQRLALKMVFKDKPFMSQLVDAADSAPVNTGSKPMPAAAGGGGGKSGSYRDLLALGKRFGLSVQGEGQTTGGRHAAGSYHYQGRAVDFGNATNSYADMMRLANYVRNNPGQFREFFWEPAGFSVKNGRLIEGNLVGGHGDHIHLARSAPGRGKGIA